MTDKLPYFTHWTKQLHRYRGDGSYLNPYNAVLSLYAELGVKGWRRGSGARASGRYTRYPSSKFNRISHKIRIFIIKYKPNICLLNIFEINYINYRSISTTKRIPCSFCMSMIISSLPKNNMVLSLNNVGIGLWIGLQMGRFNVRWVFRYLSFRITIFII